MNLAAAAKMIVIGLLALALLVPVLMIQGLIGERQALGCVGLISAYLVRVLRSARAGLASGAALAALYAMLYALLQAEDHSLLGGSLLLFGLLSIVMLGTRGVDWYVLAARRGRDAAAA